MAIFRCIHTLVIVLNAECMVILLLRLLFRRPISCGTAAELICQMRGDDAAGGARRR